MSKDDNKSKKSPQGNRFVKGQSGNPNGRPKGSRNKTPLNRIAQMILDEASRTVEVNVEGEKQTMPTLTAIIRSVNYSALKGNARAQRIALEAANAAERREDELQKTTFDQAFRYKADAEAQIAAATQMGLPRPTLLIHPDDIKLDPVTGEVVVSTLTDKQEKSIAAYLNYRLAVRDDMKGAIEELSAATTDEDRQVAIDHLVWCLEMMVGIEKSLGGPFSVQGDGSFDDLDYKELQTLND